LTVPSEFPSLGDYLRTTLTPDELGSVGLVSFNQWSFSVGALCEAALTALDLGAHVTVGLWSDDTPLPDPGWSTSRRLSRLLRTATVDQNAERGLVAAGLPSTDIVRPPIRRWRPEGLPPLPQPLTRAAIRAMRYRGSGMGRSILQVHPDFNTPVSDDHVWPAAWIEQATRSYAWAFDQTRALIRERGLQTLIVYNGRFTHDQAAASAAEAEGVRVLYYDAGGLETDFDLTAAPTHDWVDLQERMIRMWAAWDPEEREQLARAWFDGRRTHTEPSVHKFVAVQTRGHLEGVPDADQLVVFFSSSGDEFAEFDLDWADYLHSQEAALSALAAACRARPGTRLVVRTHPHMRMKPADDLTSWMAAVEQAGPDVHLDPFSPVDSYELMARADIVFTYGSTSGVESAVLGSSVVVMGPSAYDILGCARRIRTAEEIPDCLEHPPAPDPIAALPYGLMMMRRGFTFDRVGRDERRVPVVGGVALDEPSQLVRNLSHARLMRLKQRLTR
jgi:hypothetical protein